MPKPRSAQRPPSPTRRVRQPSEPAPAAPAHDPVEALTAGEPLRAAPPVRLLSSETQAAQRQALAVHIGRRHGNQHLGHLMAALRPVQRQPVDAGAADAGPVAGVADPDAEMAAFRAHGPYPGAPEGELIQPGTGMGGFNASYDPNRMELTVTLNIAMTFVDGLTIAGNTVAAGDPSLTGAATQINAALSTLSGPQLTAALDQIRVDWQWAGAGDPRIAAWMADYRSTVQSAWSSAGTGIVFQSSQPGWETQIARVNVATHTTNVTAPAGGGPVPAGPTPTHCTAQIFKTPDRDVGFGAEVGPGLATRGDDQTLRLGSGQVAAPQQLLTQSVGFGHDSAVLTEAAKAHLRRWIISFQAPAGGAGTTIELTGHANTVGGGTAAGDAYNQRLSERRAQAVEQFLKTEVVEGRTLANATTRIRGVVGQGSAGATAGAEWRRVDIVAAGGQSQNVAVHEFGHMIGMHDEYASTPERDAAGNIVTDPVTGRARTRGLISGTGGEVGDPTGSNQLATEMGLGGSVFENNDNIMSLGNTIRPQHYSTFMEALRRVTASDAWRLRA